jgi:hypothetical protein
MKFVLILMMCSYSANTCMPPLEWPQKFDSGYDCSIFGYEEAARKLKEIGPADVDRYKISITFSCNEIAET